MATLRFCNKLLSKSHARIGINNYKSNVSSNQFCGGITGISSHGFLNEIISGNIKWCSEHKVNEMTERYEENKQTPIATILSCCDSRAPTSALGATAPNSIFSVQNIGNQFNNSVGSFRYGIEALQTPYAIIMGHTNCGAIRAAASDYRYLHTMVQQEVISLVRVIRFADSLTNSMILDDMPFDIRCNVYSEINVDWQIMRLLDDWQIVEKVNTGKLNIIGMMFDIHNIYNKGHGKLHIVNINGDRDVLSLKQHPLLMQFNSNFGYDHFTPQMDIASRLFSYSATTQHSRQYSHV